MTRQLQLMAVPPAVLAHPAVQVAELEVLPAFTRLGETMATV
jgi:hypothetical protein